MRLEYFQLIDRIVDLKLADRSIAVEATVPTQSTIFEGHFPGYPLMPGVLLGEAMAQTSGWLIIALNRFERMPFLAAMKDLKLRSFVRPGERLDLSATLAHDGSGFALTRAEARLDGRIVCDATITFRVVDFPNPEMRGHMEAQAEVLAFPREAMTHG